MSGSPATLNLADKLAQFADRWNPRRSSRLQTLADATTVLGARDIGFVECDR